MPAAWNRCGAQRELMRRWLVASVSEKSKVLLIVARKLSAKMDRELKSVVILSSAPSQYWSETHAAMASDDLTCGITPCYPSHLLHLHTPMPKPRRTLLDIHPPPLNSLQLPQRQHLQLLPIHPQLNPLILLLRPQPAIELQTRLIPLQAAPLQPPPIHPQHLPRQLLYEQLPVPPSPVLFADEQIFEVETGFGAPGGVGGEVDGHARDTGGYVVGVVFFFGRGEADEQGAGVAGVGGAGGGGEGEGAGEGGFGCKDRCRVFLVRGELLD